MNSQNLTLEYKKSILHGIITIEHIPMDIFNLLINSDLLSNEQYLTYNNEKEQLIKYKKLIKNNKATINYIKCKGIKYGRVNPKNGLGLHYMKKKNKTYISKRFIC